jgi:diguanylate cyclase (GGDEF)-like protein
VPAALNDRRITFALAAAVYGAVYAAFVLADSPALGIGHFFYVAVCIVALRSDALRGALAGVVATGVYALAVLTAPHVPPSDVLTTAAAIRAVTFCGVGTLVGLYASRNRGLVAELRRHSLEDFLTGIGNARAFDEELARRCTAGQAFTLVLADIDDFGHINDTHGHEAGNVALQRVGAAMRGVLGRTDVVARIGGDEFALITNRPLEETTLVCRRISRAVASASIHLSFGTTASPGDGTTAVELFRKADDRLFAAKLVSRNRRTVVELGRS